MLIFTIDNSDSPTVGADDLAFTDTLPIGVMLASPAFVSNTCGGTVSAPDGGGTIGLSDGMVGAGMICTIVVNVTAEAVDGSDTTHTNTSGALSSTLGSSGTATDMLMVDIDRPGFSKSFDPATVEFGGRSTLTFTIDNSESGTVASVMRFTDTLPAGMVVADPANASTDCDFFSTPALTAVPGTDVISLFFGRVDDGDTCTVSVDVIGGAVGSLGNVSGELESTVGVLEDLSSGKVEECLPESETRCPWLQHSLQHCPPHQSRQCQRPAQDCACLQYRRSGQHRSRTR